MKKNTATTELPKLADMPNPECLPAVVAIRDRYNVLQSKLSATRTERKDLEKDIGAKAGESDEDLEAKLMARGHSTESLSKLRELRRSEQVAEKAVAIVRDELTRAREEAARELTVSVREQFFMPAVQAAVKDWLNAVKKIETFRQIVEELQGRGLGSGTFCPFNGRVPLSLADKEGFVGFVAELISDGFTTRDTVNGIFPGLI